jgi:hypothetical protein
MPDRLDEITARLRAFVAEREWAQFHDPKNLAVAVASEAADVGIALLLLCDRVGIDLVGAMGEKIELNARNYPVSLSKGRHSRPGA